MKKKPCRPSILNGLKEQLEGQFQMSEGHVLEFKELKAQPNIEINITQELLLSHS